MQLWVSCYDCELAIVTMGLLLLLWVGYYYCGLAVVTVNTMVGYYYLCWLLLLLLLWFGHHHCALAIITVAWLFATVITMG